MGQAPDTIRPADGVIYQSAVGGGGLVINTVTGEQYVLDAVAADMWSAVTDADSQAGAIDDLLAKYEVDRRELTSDVEEFVADLVERGLLRRG